MSEIKSEPEKMLDVLFYREAVLEIVLCGKHIAREVYQLRLTLFLQAADYYFSQKQEVLEPFPSCFFDPTTMLRRYEELKECLSSIQNLEKIDENISLPELTWELLHWIFTNPLKIKVEKESPISDYLNDELREETKLTSIPYPSRQCMRFPITHPSEINSTKQFLKHKAKLGSFYAYHGSPASNFHSIIHRGLRCTLNKVGVYGPGTYLTSDLNTAKSYSLKFSHLGGSGSRVVNHKLENSAGIKFCVAIVEVIKDPSIKVVNLTKPSGKISHGTFDNPDGDLLYYVVNCDEYLRLKHLLVFYI